MSNHYYLANQPVNGSIVSKIVRARAGAILTLTDEEHKAVVGGQIPLASKLIYQGSDDSDVEKEQTKNLLEEQQKLIDKEIEESKAQQLAEDYELAIAKLGLNPLDFAPGTSPQDPAVKAAVLAKKAEALNAEEKNKAAHKKPDAKAPDAKAPEAGK